MCCWSASGSIEHDAKPGENTVANGRIVQVQEVAGAIHIIQRTDIRVFSMDQIIQCAVSSIDLLFLFHSHSISIYLSLQQLKEYTLFKLNLGSIQLLVSVTKIIDVGPWNWWQPLHTYS